MNNFDPSKFRTPELFQKLLDIAPQDPHSAVLEEVEEHIMDQDDNQQLPTPPTPPTPPTRFTHPTAPDPGLN